MRISPGRTESAPAAVLVAALLIILIPWMEAAGRTTVGLWLDLLAHFLALLLAAFWLVGAWRRAAPRWSLGLLPVALVLWLAGRHVPYPYAARVVQAETGVALLLAVALSALLAGASGSRSRCLLARIWVLAAIPASLAAVYQVLFLRERGTAGFANPNHLAAFLVAALPLALVQGRGREGENHQAAVRRRWLMGGLTGLVLAGLLASGSRAGLLAAPACLGVFRWRAVQTGTVRRYWRQLVGVLTVSLLMIFAATFLWRFSDGTDIYRYDRLRIWPQAWSMAREAPWLGIGPGQFHHQARAHNFARQETAVRFGRVFRSPHSHLFLILVETGGVGLLAFCACLFWISRVARDPADLSDGAPESLSLLVATPRAALWSLVGLMIFSLVDEPLAHPPLKLGAALLLALALPASIPGPVVRRAPLVRLSALVVLVTLFLGLGLQTTLAEQAALSAAQSPDPVKRARLLERAAWLNPYQPFYPGDEAALLLSYAAHPLDIVSYARIRTLADEAIRLAPGEAGFRLNGARIERRACVELFRNHSSCERVLAQYQAAAARAPLDPRILREGAAFLCRLERCPEAVVWLRRAVQVEPAYVGAWEDLVRILDENRETRDADREGLRRARRRAASSVPDSPYARDILASVPLPVEPAPGGGS